MSLTKFEYTKDWNNPNDFPTIENSEINVRRDMQSLYDEAKDGINHLIDELESRTSGSSGAKQIGLTSPSGSTATNVQAIVNEHQSSIAELDEMAHTHANKGLLDTYTQTNADIADAIAKKHSHSNKGLLDTYDQTNSNITDAVAKKHSHDNKGLLDTYNQTNANLTDAVSKKHSHTNLSALESVPSGGVVTTLGNDNTTVPTSKAVADALSIAGHGDMLKSSYDTTNTGNKVDTARNAEKLGGQLPSYYAKASDIPTGGGDMLKANYDPNNTGNKVATAQNAEKLNGQAASYYAAASSLSGYMAKSAYDTGSTGNKVDTAKNAEKLGGELPSYYAKASDIPSTVGDMMKANYDPNNTGSKVAVAQNAEKLNGQSASYYATASALTNYMAKSAYDSGNTGSKVDTAKNAEKLNGQLPTYYATASALATKQDTITSSTDLTVRKLTGGLNYDSSAPAAANTYGIKFVVLSAEPATKQDGWLYIITDSE